MTKVEDFEKTSKNQLINSQFNSIENQFENDKNLIKNEKKDDSMSTRSNEKIINKFIVTVEEKTGFYNIYPLYKIKDGRLIAIEGKDYPDYGNYL